MPTSYPGLCAVQRHCTRAMLGNARWQYRDSRPHSPVSSWWLGVCTTEYNHILVQVTTTMQAVLECIFISHFQTKLHIF
jgi:hypothetical protein